MEKYNENLMIYVNEYRQNFEQTIEMPNCCPYCGNKVNFIIQYKDFFYKNNSDAVDFDKIFIAATCPSCYKTVSIVNRKAICLGSDCYVLLNYSPSPKEEIKFNESITQISPDFIRIYNQAYNAKLAEFDELVGCGYRKALEFLIVDFLKKVINLSDDEIKKEKTLGAKIKNLLPEDFKKQTLTLATWMGNDETHYYKEYDYTNGDLEKHIKVFCNLIENYMVEKESSEKVNAKQSNK